MKYLRPPADTAISHEPTAKTTLSVMSASPVVMSSRIEDACDGIGAGAAWLSSRTRAWAFATARRLSSVPSAEASTSAMPQSLHVLA